MWDDIWSSFSQFAAFLWTLMCLLQSSPLYEFLSTFATCACISKSPGMTYLPVRLMTFLAVKKKIIVVVFCAIRQICYPVSSNDNSSIGFRQNTCPIDYSCSFQDNNSIIFCVSIWLDIADMGLAKAEVTVGDINRKVNVTDMTDNSFILLFLII